MKRTPRLFVFLAAILLLIIGVLIVLVFLGSNAGRDSKAYNKITYDSVRDKTVFERTMLKSSLSGGFSYEKDENSKIHTLLSPRGSKNFRCRGTCFCNEERRSSISVSRSIFFLLAAASTVAAIDISRSYFQSVCESEYSDSCSLGFVHAEVDDCEIGTSTEESDESASDAKDGKESYDCEGHCLPDNVYMLEVLKPSTDVVKFFNMQRFVGVACADSHTEATIYIDPKEDAEAVFDKTVLSPKCLSHGKKVWPDFAKEFELPVEAGRSICRSANPPGWANHAIKCSGIEHLDNHHFYWGKEGDVQTKWRKTWADADKPKE